MKTSLQIFPDEPLVAPVTAGGAVRRLSEAAGVLTRRGVLTNWSQRLRERREALIAALETGSGPQVTVELQAARDCLFALYGEVSALDEGEELCAALGFPAPDAIQASKRFVQPVDLDSMVVTFSRCGKQVMANFDFREAPGATAYWLHEVRYIDGERSEWSRLEDDLYESCSPMFHRLRLAPGMHYFRIMARNPQSSAMTDEFPVDVPALN